MTLLNYPPKGNWSYRWAFLLQSSGHSLNSWWHSNLQHDHSANYRWNSDINLLIKGKLRVSCQQWKILGMDNVLQNWIHLLLLISAICTTWLHFWVDKNTELKTVKSHLHIWISSASLMAWDNLILWSMRHTPAMRPPRLTHKSVEKSFLPQTSLNT